MQDTEVNRDSGAGSEISGKPGSERNFEKCCDQSTVSHAENISETVQRKRTEWFCKNNEVILIKRGCP